MLLFWSGSWGWVGGVDWEGVGSSEHGHWGIGGLAMSEKDPETLDKNCKITMKYVNIC